MRDCDSCGFSLRKGELLRVRVELVKTSPGAEAILLTVEDLRITSALLDLHAAHWIPRRTARPYAFMFVVMVAMNHVRAAAKSHHQIKKPCE
jgi:hypothetical protein